MTDIVDVLASLDAWSQQPVRILNWSVKRPWNDANRTTVAVRIQGDDGARSEITADVDRASAKIVGVWFAEIYPVKTPARPVPIGMSLRGNVADLILTVGTQEPATR